jgi:hypothetical protein
VNGYCFTKGIPQLNLPAEEPNQDIVAVVAVKIRNHEKGASLAMLASRVVVVIIVVIVIVIVIVGKNV